MNAIQIKNLTYSYSKKKTILNDLSMAVPKGSIYGFLGANGAGKSTTIRTVLGLLKAQKGSIHLLDTRLKDASRSIFKRIGSLIEAPSLYAHLNAVEHLQLLAQYQGVSTKTIAPTLDRVGLLVHQKKPTSAYSTGMKQRLGLAMALLHDPELLILDEPVNGLDPNGITEIRKIILQLQEEGKTILLSSHLLAELERIVSHVGILQDGKLQFEGTLQSLQELKSGQQWIQIRTGDVQHAQTILSNYPNEVVDHNQVKVQISSEDQIPNLIKQVVNANISIYEVQVLKNDLEQLFINLTQQENE